MEPQAESVSSPRHGKEGSPVELWTSPVDRREPCGHVDKTVDNGLTPIS